VSRQFNDQCLAQAGKRVGRQDQPAVPARAKFSKAGSMSAVA
jgi:hypothetical protein